ncbi:MAG: C10 family peptidase [Paludibacteraceae bacterium]|nr:C10 family peptidase [Paludibacteraceae bacterium]
MRKLFLGLAALMLSMTVLAERVSQEDAALVANNFMNVGNTVSGVQKAPAKKMVLKKAATASENQYYVYENANGEGWVMVAANDVAHPILAYSYTGTFRTDNQPANLKVWLRGYDRQITRAAQDENYVANEQVQNEWKTLRKGANPVKTAVVVSPLIKTGWDQGSPYWNLCPQKSGSRCYTGCVATAMAQVMNYHQWPKQGTGSHSIKFNSNMYTVNFGTTTYDWDNMLDRYDSGNPTTAQKNAVATLMYHCGVAVDMQYGTADEGGSGAYTIDYNGYWSSQGTMCAETALTQFFGYKSSTIKGYYRDGSPEDEMRSWTKAEWIAMLKEELDAQRPIMYAGAGYEDPSDPNTGYGHSFVCDGYDSSDKFHFNWGWSNSCDGYYDVDALEPSEPGSGGGNGEYNLEQDVIIGIVPDKKDLPMITITWSVDGVETTSEIMQEAPLVLPANPANCENGKVFVGWTANSTVEGNKPADLFTTAAGKTVTEAITYYAVFATEEGGGSKDITLDATKDTSFPKDGITLTTSSGALDNGTDYRIYKGATLTITSSVGDMSSIAFTFSGSYDGGGWESTYTPNAATWTSPACTSGSSGKQARITKIVVTVGSSTYSDYSLTCSGVTPEPVYYNIRFYNNGNQIGEPQSVLKNQQAEVPTGIKAECEDYTFVGWWTAELPADNTEAKTWVTNFKATKDQDYYAIFSKTEEGQGGEVAFDGNTGGSYKIYAQKDDTKYYAIASINTSNKLETTTDEAKAASFSFTKVEGGFTIQAGEKYLAYNGNSTNVGLKDDAYTWDIQASEAGFGSWRAIASTANTRALVLRVNTYQSFGAYATSNINGTEYFDLEIGGGAPAATTYYSSIVTCGETAIDNNVVAPKAIKVLENGQIVIILGDQKYTIFGQKIQ